MFSDLTVVYRRRHANIRKREDAELMGILGWSVLVLTAIPVLFSAIGLVAGSRFWLWWAVLQALAGLGVLAVSRRQYAHSARLAESHHKCSTVEEAQVAAENYESWAA